MAWLVARKFDVYVIDADMQGASALGICCTIRAVDKEGAVICLSTDEDDHESLLEAGADLFLKLPEGACKLRRVMDDMLDSPKSDAVH